MITLTNSVLSLLATEQHHRDRAGDHRRRMKGRRTWRIRWKKYTLYTDTRRATISREKEREGVRNELVMHTDATHSHTNTTDTVQHECTMHNACDTTSTLRNSPPSFIRQHGHQLIHRERRVARVWSSDRKLTTLYVGSYCSKKKKAINFSRKIAANKMKPDWTSHARNINYRWGFIWILGATTLEVRQFLLHSHQYSRPNRTRILFPSLVLIPYHLKNSLPPWPNFR